MKIKANCCSDYMIFCVYGVYCVCQLLLTHLFHVLTHDSCSLYLTCVCVLIRNLTGVYYIQGNVIKEYIVWVV